MSLCGSMLGVQGHVFTLRCIIPIVYTIYICGSSLEFMENYNSVVLILFGIMPLKGTVSRELRWVLQYINQKLFSRAIVAHHKILILLKGILCNVQKKIQRRDSRILNYATKGPKFLKATSYSQITL